MFAVKEEVILITGGLGGIGLAIAKELLRNGAKATVLLDINNDNGEDILRGIAKEFGPNKAIFVNTDITNAKQVEDAFKKTIDQFKSVNVVVNCAGIIKENDMSKVADVNLISAHRIMMLAMEKYFPDRESLVVNVSSVAGLDPSHVIPVYSATKSALIAIGRSYGTPYFYEKYKTRILTVCPGMTETPLVSDNLAKHDDDMMGEFRKAATILPFQTPEELAQGLIHVIKEGKNGSVWVIEADLPYEIIFHDREESRRRCAAAKK